jgi:hypothetical protein
MQGSTLLHGIRPWVRRTCTLLSPCEIDATDRQIDQLVYHLYGLTPDEVVMGVEATG